MPWPECSAAAHKAIVFSIQLGALLHSWHLSLKVWKLHHVWVTAYCSNKKGALFFLHWKLSHQIWLLPHKWESSSSSAIGHTASQLWQSSFSVFCKVVMWSPLWWCLYLACMLIKLRGSLRAATSSKRSLGCMFWVYVVCVVSVPF